MKKLLAVLSLIGVATTLTACSQAKVDNYENNIQDFKEHVHAYANVCGNENTKMIVGKYMLETKIEDAQPKIQVAEEKSKDDKAQNLKEDNKTTAEIANDEDAKKEGSAIDTPILKEKVEISKSDENEKFSTLYSLTDDMENCCEDFTELKQNLTDAIVETQNLIKKVNSKEIELTNEQKLLIAEQSKQLKDLGRKLSSVTTELSISLSDLGDLLNKGDFDGLSLKYLIVLDNLINGNEMLENGLHSLNLINSMFNAGAPIPPNNTGRILYGFRKNNEPPIVKDYLIDKNGNITENQEQNENKESENSQTEKNGNIDSFQTNKLEANIDTYRNNNSNVDTFFNTALLDNEFMYGNGGGMMGNGLMYGYGNMNGFNQNGNNFNQQNFQNETNSSVNNNQNTQYNEASQNNQDAKKTKKKKLAKNIDTYKDENTPTLSTRFGKLKKSISGFLNKISRKKENPIYRRDLKD